jgi:NAD(P)-dependent dehydrogenase (short-subunit alcohol dehydrogenase family)
MKIIITGGASGLGGSITRAFARDVSNTVCFTYNNSRQKAEQILKDHGNSIAVKCDFRNEEERKRLTDSIRSFDPDVLINNAYSGEFLSAHFHKTPSEDFLTNFRDNIIPVIEITQAAIECFRKKKQGRIITILTAALTNVPPMGSAVYIAGKAYLEKLTKVWATENGRFNISSNSVSPSFLSTDLTAGFDERVVSQITESHPLKRLLTVEEVTESVLFLAKASPQLNGIDILMNAAMNIK